MPSIFRLVVAGGFFAHASPAPSRPRRRRDPRAPRPRRVLFRDAYANAERDLLYLRIEGHQFRRRQMGNSQEPELIACRAPDRYSDPFSYWKVGIHLINEAGSVRDSFDVTNFAIIVGGLERDSSIFASECNGRSLPDTEWLYTIRPNSDVRIERRFEAKAGDVVDGVVWRDAWFPPAVVWKPFLSTLSSGVWHTCALRLDSSVVCWGDNEHGQSSPSESVVFASIAAGGSHTCTLLHDGSPACRGANHSGQASPPGGERFASISSGTGHTCALRLDGSPVCWGNNRSGPASPTKGERFALHQQRRGTYLRAYAQRVAGLLGAGRLRPSIAAGRRAVCFHQQRRMAHLRSPAWRIARLLGTRRL